MKYFTPHTDASLSTPAYGIRTARLYKAGASNAPLY